MQDFSWFFYFGFIYLYAYSMCSLPYRGGHWNPRTLEIYPFHSRTPKCSGYPCDGAHCEWNG